MTLLSDTSAQATRNNRFTNCRMLFGIRAVFVWIMLLILVLMTSLLVASEFPGGNSSDSLPDIWVPVELFNMTFTNLTTETPSTGVSSKKNASDKPRGSRIKKKKNVSSSSSSSTTPAPSTTSSTSNRDSPKAEALRSPMSKTLATSLADNQMALFSVDAWMGNLAELPQPRVEELRALAAASMRNHQKLHPSQVAGTMPKGSTSSRNNNNNMNGAPGAKYYRKKDPIAGESMVDEHQFTPADEESAEFPHEEEVDAGGSLGNSQPPGCAGFHKFYCDASNDYPTALINQVTKYLKWPLEKLFRDIRDLHPPTLADSESGNLVCDSITKIIRPGWARNTNGKWLVVINTPYHIQTVTEIKCRSEASGCAYIAPCFHSSCQQRYNIQSLLVIDPNNHYKGPFLSQFLFPSSCVCFVPDPKLVAQAQCQAAVKYDL